MSYIKDPVASKVGRFEVRRVESNESVVGIVFFPVFTHSFQTNKNRQPTQQTHTKTVNDGTS